MSILQQAGTAEAEFGYSGLLNIALGPSQQHSMTEAPQQQMPREEREHILGSGVIVSSDGYVLANNEVIDGASEIEGAQ